MSHGLSDLDSLTNGLHPGQMIVIGARPAMGKSTLALDFARACTVKHGRPAALFSLEMGREEIVNRLYSAESRVALHHITSGNITEDDLDRMARRTQDIECAPLIVDDSPNLTMLEIRSRARRIKQNHGLDLVVVDYLQLMQSGASRKAESRQQEVSDMSRLPMKLLAKELQFHTSLCPSSTAGPRGARTEPDGLGPPRVRFDRAGRGHGHPSAS
ncbi:Replicative DNA helicase OS=Streptomyces antimycoticus OX=68175 GN=SSPO_051440 PE=3 SV=1 [Streptomyces antimycoticus]